ncbi:MAG: ABC transporter permease, partial [Deltaproteobacteria bacterium]
ARQLAEAVGQPPDDELELPGVQDVEGFDLAFHHWWFRARGRTAESNRTARAKGASAWRHAFKEGFLIPITEIVAAKIPFILSGAVVVEQVFNWPGMGRMAWQAALDRDYPVIMGIAVVAALFVRFGTLTQRVVYVMVNPRASQEKGRGWRG